eukprot:COSAG02_NODE_3651_length_6415_cov_50.343097_6_plen_114_part_00
MEAIKRAGSLPIHEATPPQRQSQSMPEPEPEPEPKPQSPEPEQLGRLSKRKCAFLTGILFIVARMAFLVAIGKIPLEVVRAWPPAVNLNMRHKNFRKLLELVVYSIAYLMGCA